MAQEPVKHNQSLIPPDRAEYTSRSGWIVLVVVLAASLGYLYLFTDLLRSPSAVRYRLDQPIAAGSRVQMPAAHEPPAPPKVVPEKPAKKTAQVRTAPEKHLKGAAVVRAPWRVLVGSYVVPATAQRVEKLVSAAGYTPQVKEAADRQVTFYRLLVTTVATPQQAATALTDLKKTSATAFSEQRGSRIAIYSSSHAARHGAEAERRELAARGIPSTLQAVAVRSRVHDVQITGFPNRAAAQAAVQRLVKHGLHPRVVQ